MNLENIVDAIRQNRIRVTDHADEEAQADRLSFDEIMISVLQGQIIEDYPNDSLTRVAWSMGRRLPGIPCTVFGPIMQKTNGRF